jgi:hypothetical protein
MVMGKNKIGPKRKKGGSGMIGMGRSDLSKGRGIIMRKIQSTEDIQKRADLASKKTLATDKQAASFAERARRAKLDPPKG